MSKGKIPIAAAERLSKQYNCPVVLVFAIEETGDRFTITTYGKTKGLCRHAASLGEQFASAVFSQQVAPTEVEPKHLPDVPAQMTAPVTEEMVEAALVAMTGQRGGYHNSDDYAKMRRILEAALKAGV